MAQIEEFMFQNVVYWPTVYRTGVRCIPESSDYQINCLFFKRQAHIKDSEQFLGLNMLIVFGLEMQSMIF